MIKPVANIFPEIPANQNPPSTAAQNLSVNAANGVNPLNDLSFDINTLIPQTMFNWDCVEGIDCIHDSVMKAYGEVATNGVGKLNTIIDRVKGVDSTIVDTLGRQVNDVGATVDTVDKTIADKLGCAVNEFTDQYGNCVSHKQWYIVYRECQDGVWYPVIEQATSPPSGMESYGPFLDCWPLAYDTDSLLTLTVPHSSGLTSGDPVLQTLLESYYQTQLEVIKTQVSSSFVEGMGSQNDGTCGTIKSLGCVILPNVPSLYHSDSNQIYSPNKSIQINIPSNPPTSSDGSNSSISISNPISGNTNTINAPINIDNPVVMPTTPISTPNTCCPPIICPPTTVVNNYGTQSQGQMETQTQSQIQSEAQQQAQSQTAGASVSGANVNVKTGDVSLSDIASVLTNCCKSLTTTISESSNATASGDLQYLYSDVGQARIDTFLEDNGISAFEPSVPDTVGDSVQQHISDMAIIGGFNE